MRTIEIAAVCHAAIRAFQQVNGEENVHPEWADAPEWMRDSTVEGVLSAIEGMTPAEMHEQWSRSRRAAGWVWGHVKSEDEKTHPCLVEYSQLPAVQRAKDVLFIAVVEALRDVTR